jgi:hypothetical protein
MTRASSQDPENGASAVQKLLSFNGYGNPGGPYWFIGIEERGDGTLEALSIRAQFTEIADLEAAHSPHLLDFSLTTLIPTWATMSKIVLRSKGDSNWRERETIREYQAGRLGRLGGETFLTDLLPLPSPDATSWHYPHLWPSRDDYYRDVLPGRQDMLRGLFAAHRPRFVFCYGKSYWTDFEEILPETEFDDALEGRVRLANLGRSTVFLTPFFSYYSMTSDLIDRLVGKLIEGAG